MNPVMRGITYAILGLILSTAAFGADPFPARLTLDYSLSRNGHEIGVVTRTLERNTDGRYAHTLWMRATGLTALVYRTEWREHGVFVVKDGDVLPQRFTETRTGDKRAYEHGVTFDRTRMLLVFGQQQQKSLSPGVQDQGSLIYALMLKPLTAPGERMIAVTDGKDVDTYALVYRGRESVSTPLGVFETIVIRRITPKQLEQETRCQREKLPDEACRPDDLTFWLAPARNHAPVKLERRRKDETTTMILREARGL